MTATITLHADRNANAAMLHHVDGETDRKPVQIKAGTQETIEVVPGKKNMLEVTERPLSKAEIDQRNILESHNASTA